MQKLSAKRSLLRTLLGVYLFLFFVLVCCSLSVPPGDLPLWGLQAAIAVVGIILTRGEGRGWRVTWGIALGVAILFAAFEVVTGYRIQQQHSRADDSWDQYAHLLTTNEPRRNEIVGSYKLTQQTITSNGLAAVNGRIGELELRADGSFLVTNYPVWGADKVDDFVSTNGRWKIDSVGSAGNQEAWGVRFSQTDHRIDDPGFTGTAAPYNLLFTHGDPDGNQVMIFEKTK